MSVQSAERIADRVFDKPGVGTWYADAVIYRLSVSSFCDGDGDGIGDFEGLAAQLPYLRTLGVTCLQLSPLPRAAAGDLARFLPAARHHLLHVLLEVDLPEHDRRAARARNEAKFWLDAGADGVIFPWLPVGLSVERSGARAPEHAQFFALNGVPVPCIPEGHLRELGAFRAQAVPAIVEALGRENVIPVLGLIIRLALRVVDGRIGVWTADELQSADDVRQSRNAARRLVTFAGRDPRRADLMRTLAFSLPGPTVLVSGDEMGMSDADAHDAPCEGAPTNVDYPSLVAIETARGRAAVPRGFSAADSKTGSSLYVLEKVRMLAAARRRSPALSCGLASPVGLGAGPGLAFVRESARDVVLVVANFSAEPLEVSCDLTAYKGREAIEILHRRRFPPVFEDRYSVFLPPYGCCWLDLVAS